MQIQEACFVKSLDEQSFLRPVFSDLETRFRRVYPVDKCLLRSAHSLPTGYGARKSMSANQNTLIVNLYHEAKSLNRPLLPHKNRNYTDDYLELDN